MSLRQVFVILPNPVSLTGILLVRWLSDIVEFSNFLCWIVITDPQMMSLTCSLARAKIYQLHMPLH